MARQCIQYSMFCPTDATLLKRVAILCGDELRLSQTGREKHALPIDYYAVNLSSHVGDYEYGTPFSPSDIFRRFGGTNFLHLQWCSSALKV